MKYTSEAKRIIRDAASSPVPANHTEQLTEMLCEMEEAQRLMCRPRKPSKLIADLDELEEKLWQHIEKPHEDIPPDFFKSWANTMQEFEKYIKAKREQI